METIGFVLFMVLWPTQGYCGRYLLHLRGFNSSSFSRLISILIELFLWIYIGHSLWVKSGL